MRPLRRPPADASGAPAGAWPLAAYDLAVRARNKAFSLATRRAYGSFGSHSVISLPFRSHGTRGIHVGDGVFVGPDCWLETHAGGQIQLGSGVRIVGRVTITAWERVALADDVLVAAGVYISDVSHRFDDRSRPIHAQGTTDPRPVRIGAGAWLAQNAVVLPGVTIGAGAVVAANAVVREDVPEGAVAAGVPARIVGRR